MKIVLQRVREASVTVAATCAGKIGLGLVVLLGVERGDSRQDADFLAARLLNLRIFADEAGKMNRDALETGADVLVVSQFTLCGNTVKGRRPSFDDAAPPAEARELYEYFIARIRETGLRVETGVFQASMLVSLVNDGPVTFILESKKH